MKLLLTVLLAMPVCADDCRVLVDGTGCRTRQLAIERIFEKLPDIREVTILPRSEAPADNQRVFLLRSTGAVPTREALVAALGRRARHYQVISVTPAALTSPPTNVSPRNDSDR